MVNKTVKMTAKISVGDHVVCSVSRCQKLALVGMKLSGGRYPLFCWECYKALRVSFDFKIDEFSLGRLNKKELDYVLGRQVSISVIAGQLPAIQGGE